MTNPGMIKLKQIMIVKVQTWKNSGYRIFANLSSESRGAK